MWSVPYYPQWQPISAANKVYVSGQSQGVLVGVTRTGTAGDKALAMITEPLITAVDAGRYRGIAALADAERRSQNTLALPLDAGIAGLVLPGTLLEVTGDETSPWRAIVRATQISAGLSDSALKVGQQITVERHYPETA